MERLTMRVFGRVQGVGFRMYTQDQARDLGLDGWVRNEPDGSVALVAEGEASALDALEAWVRAGGPPSGQVTRCERDRGGATGEFRGFVVRR